MSERFIFTKHRVRCYRCQKMADQTIKAVSSQAQVQCSNCGATGLHDLIIGCGQFTTRCRNCGYTHFYKFSLEYVAQSPIESADLPEAARTSGKS